MPVAAKTPETRNGSASLPAFFPDATRAVVRAAHAIGVGVEQTGDRPRHPLVLHARQVVAHGQVEDHSRRVPGETESSVQGVNQHPGVEILTVRLFDAELL